MKHPLLMLREFREFASQSEKAIIDCVLQSPERVVNLSVRELAAELFASPSTIIRLCHKVGFEGYKELKKAIGYELMNRAQALDDEKKEITKTDSMEEIVEKITNKNILSLEDTRKLADIATLEKCVDLLRACRTICLFGISSSLNVANDAALKFIRLGKPVFINADWHNMLMQARAMEKEDLGIVISYSGQTVEMIECMKAMKENGCQTISITKFGTSPISEMSNYSLYVASNESLFRSGAMSSRVSQLNVIDILYTGYANRDFDDSMRRLSKTHIHK